MKTEIISKLEALLSQPNILSLSHKFFSIEREYKSFWTKEFELAKVDYIENGGKAKEFEYVKSKEDLEIVSLIKKVKKRKKEEEAKLIIEQSKNFEIKNEIILKINDLSQVSTSISAAVKKIVELQALWKATGNVPNTKQQEIQNTYTKAIDAFNYKLNLSKQINLHDLKKNYELKKEVIEKFKNLIKNENIQEVKNLFNIYKKEWVSLGYVSNEYREELSTSYKEVIEAINQKFKLHQEVLLNEHGNNLNLKNELIKKIESINWNSKKFKFMHEWVKAGDAVIHIQSKWKTIGKVTAEENEKVWETFKQKCNTFFDNKKSYLKTHKAKSAENKSEKQNLIEAAKAINQSADWNITEQKIFDLQQKWKKLPHLGKDENSLVERFKEACDVFFSSKNKHFEHEYAQLIPNISLKENIIKKANEFVFTNQKNTDQLFLDEIVAEWLAIGALPPANLKSLNTEFNSWISLALDKLKFNEIERITCKFKIKLNQFYQMPNTEALLKSEADYLKKKCEEIDVKIKSQEANLGFFKPNKNEVNPLMKGIQDAITQDLKNKTVYNEHRKLIIVEIKKLQALNDSKAQSKIDIQQNTL